MSDDDGLSWSAPRPLSGDVHGVEPKLLRLANGALVLSSGRSGLYVWAAADPPSGPQSAFEWTRFNVAASHNAAMADPASRFRSDTPDQSETTGYTGMVIAAEEGVDGDGQCCSVILTYDRLANGWDPAPYPDARSEIFAMRIAVRVPAKA